MSKTEEEGEQPSSGVFFFLPVSDELIEQGSFIRLTLHRGQGIVDAIRELTGFGQPFQTKLKALIRLRTALSMKQAMIAQTYLLPDEARYALA